MGTFVLLHITHVLSMPVVVADRATGQLTYTNTPHPGPPYALLKYFVKLFNMFPGKIPCHHAHRWSVSVLYHFLEFLYSNTSLVWDKRIINQMVVEWELRANRATTR